MTVGGKTFEERKEAGTALIAACAGLKAVHSEGVIGDYHGFSLHSNFNTFNQQFKLGSKGNAAIPLRWERMHWGMYLEFRMPLAVLKNSLKKQSRS